MSVFQVLEAVQDVHAEHVMALVHWFAQTSHILISITDQKVCLIFMFYTGPSS